MAELGKTTGAYEGFLEKNDTCIPGRMKLRSTVLFYWPFSQIFQQSRRNPSTDLAVRETASCPLLSWPLSKLKDVWKQP